jgi:hypothetical protein
MAVTDSGKPETNRVHLLLFGMQKRTSGLYLTAVDLENPDGRDGWRQGLHTAIPENNRIDLVLFGMQS